MADHILAISEAKPSRPIAMTIGVLHTERVLSILKTHGASYVLLTPDPLHPNFGLQSSAEFGRSEKGLWARVNPGTLGSALNAKHKPPPKLGKASTQSYASMEMASIIVAEAARAGNQVPDAVWDQLVALPEISFQRDSFTHVGSDIIFSAILKTPDGGSQEVWARVGTVLKSNQPEGQSLEQWSLERKLLQSIADLQAKPVAASDGNQIPPREPPADTTISKNEGPGDYQDKNLDVQRLNTGVAALYGKRDTVVGAGRLGG
jgi:hypothetical protein